MYGDTRVIRRLADRMDQRAGDLRTQMDGLRGAAESAAWVSVAGTRMRDRVAERATGIEETALSYEEAATALRHHAREVDELKALIEAIEKKIRSLVHAALDRLRAAADALLDAGKGLLGMGDDPDASDERLASFAQPPPGDKAWLDAPEQLGVRI